MRTKFLFPNKFKRWGWIMLIPSAIMGLLVIFIDLEFPFLDSKLFTIYAKGLIPEPIVFGFTDGNYTSTLTGILFIIGAVFVAFSKEKQEDEFILRTRLESLLWATYVNYGILIFCFLFFFGMEFLLVMIFNMFTVLIFFILRFYYMLYRSNKFPGDEK